MPQYTEICLCIMTSSIGLRSLKQSKGNANVVIKRIETSNIMEEGELSMCSR